MELRVLGGALWRQRLLVLLILAITALAVLAGLRVAPKTYESSATLSVTGAGGDEPESTELVLGTLAQLANSSEVVAVVRGALADDFGVTRSTEDLRRSISGAWESGTLLVRVTVSDADPVVAAQIANLVAGNALPQRSPDDDVRFTTRDVATPAASYTSPNLLLSGGVGAVLACILAACGALLRDHRTHTVDDASAVEEAATAPLLAHVPTPRDPTTLPALYPGTAAAEVFRHLRVALEAESSRGSDSRVVVAGITAGDVNVWLGANLAISLAKVGRQVLLVDGRLGGEAVVGPVDEPDTPGLYDVLMGVELDDALSPGPVDLLSVLPAGSWSGTSAQTLLESHFADVMAVAQERFDVVVVLAPPLDRSDDARAMAAGGLMLLAVPEGGVSATALRAHADRVRAVGARLLGTVLVGRRAERAAA